MGKLKLAAELLKLNSKLGLLDLGDLVGLASTAYKVKTFDPMDHVPEFDFFVDEEMEKAERRKNLLLAGAAAGTAYLLYKNKDSIAQAFNQSKAPELAKDVESKGKKVISDVKEKGEEIAEEVEDKIDDVKDGVKKEDKKAIESREVKHSFYDNY